MCAEKVPGGNNFTQNRRLWGGLTDPDFGQFLNKKGGTAPEAGGAPKQK